MDIDIYKIYEENIRPVFSLEMAESLKDGEAFSCGIDGICEHCGLVHIGVDNNFNLIGVFIDKPVKAIGHIDKETFELELDGDWRINRT